MKKIVNHVPFQFDMDEPKNDVPFTEEELENFKSFAEILKRIHTRLIAEGYTIKDGVITPPEKLK